MAEPIPAPSRVTLAVVTLDEVVRQFGRAPAREHVSLTPTKAPTGWYLWGAEGRWVGFGALLRVSRHRARVKGLWVRPEDRGRGFGTEGVSLLCEFAEDRGFIEVDQFAIQPQFWLDRGWRPLARPRANGAQHLLASLPLPRRL